MYYVDSVKNGLVMSNRLHKRNDTAGKKGWASIEEVDVIYQYLFKAHFSCFMTSDH